MQRLVLRFRKSINLNNLLGTEVTEDGPIYARPTLRGRRRRTEAGEVILCGLNGRSAPLIPLSASGSGVGNRFPSAAEQSGGNLRSIVWQADLAAPGATQWAAREAPELVVEAAAGVDRPAETLVLFDKLLRMRG